MHPCPIHQPAALMPHSGRMVLLDSIIYYDEHSLRAHASIQADHILLPYGADALPTYLAVEIMAQGIAAWAGIHATQQGKPIRLGFLLGTRKLALHTPSIPIGTVLTITIQQSWQDNTGMGVFDCALHCHQAAPQFQHSLPAGTLLANGALNVFAPQSDADLHHALNKP